MTSALLRLSLLAFIAGLTSCTTHYKGPDATDPTKATLTNNTSSGFYKYEHYWVQQVDGLPIDYSWEAPKSKKIYLTPGRHRVVVQASQSGGFQSAPWKNEVELIVEARTGRWYKPKGHVQGQTFVVWIEEEGTGKNVTGKTTIPLLPAMQGPPPMLPIPPVMLQ